MSKFLSRLALAPALAMFTLVMLPLDGQAQIPGNPDRGRQDAARLCSDCHLTEPGKKRLPSQKAPNFTSVAKTRGMSAMALNVWLQTSHPTMPDIVLSADTRDDIVAYILSLRARGSSKPQPTQTAG